LGSRQSIKWVVMIKRSDLVHEVEHQLLGLKESDTGYERDLLLKLQPQTKTHALIITGIRRCGKSTLMRQLINKTGKKAFFLNFDTPRLYNFEMVDFEFIDTHIIETKSKALFFDEIQVVQGWELYVRKKLDEGYQVVVTGSNASLMSRELGTKLTGRNITAELFPFSYREYCKFNALKPGKASLADYVSTGGFPEFVKTHNQEIHAALIDDLLYRDIAVRHNLRDIRSLKQLLTFLAVNTGCLVSATKLTQILTVKSTATVLEYFGFFEQAYLVQFVPKFSWSYKVQLVNPRKVYFIDNGLLNGLTASFSDNDGRKLENMVFWELRRSQYEIYYYNEKSKECDFVVCKKNKVIHLIQVCFRLTGDNESRETESLLEAMEFFGMKEGIIITFDQSDTILRKGKRISVIPAYDFPF